MDTRLSFPADIPALRALWSLAFGDDGAYVDNFFHTYYRPDRVLVLEEEGQVRSMTAWFDTVFVVPGRGKFRAAYLYAVATHPDCRGKGLAARLLKGADEYFRTLSIPAVTTVPAEPSLHSFFGANGLRECFVHQSQGSQLNAERPGSPVPPSLSLEALSPASYGALREELLEDIPHIFYPEDALTYQAGCCALGGGGLYRADTPYGPALLCVEWASQEKAVVKELLAGPQAAGFVREEGHLLSLLGASILEVRSPVREGFPVPFGMLKWLDSEGAEGWDWSSTGYLGLAFD